MNTSSNKSYSSNILKGLLRILNEKGENDKITSYIEVSDNFWYFLY